LESKAELNDKKEDKDTETDKVVVERPSTPETTTSTPQTTTSSSSASVVDKDDCQKGDHNDVGPYFKSMDDLVACGNMRSVNGGVILPAVTASNKDV
jgi:hypothetical protein